MNRAPLVKDLPFQDMPRQSELFLKYVAQAPEVMAWYRCRPSHDNLADTADLLRRESFPRQEMAEVLNGQNECFGSSAAVRKAIADLAKPDSVAVLTGQQAGLFTGPILTIYKALTALRLSAELRRMGFNAVPIFWIASDDHDLAEVTRLTITGPHDEVHELDARTLLFGTEVPTSLPVGAIKLPEAISGLISDYFAVWPGAWNDELKTQATEAYLPGYTLAEAFGRLMAGIFRNRGLILFDPRAPAAKEHAAAIIHEALVAAHALRAQLAERGQALHKEGLEPQVAVLPRSTLVFLEAEAQRRSLIAGEQDFLFKETGRHFSLDELLNLTKTESGRFSPNVLLRPVVQDHLFPTVAYVGGPAEVSYFAQIEPLYRHFRRLMPVVWPRNSFTVFEPEICASMARYGLSLEDCFQGKAAAIRRILRAQPTQYEVLLDKLGLGIKRDIEELRPSLASVDASLGPACDTMQRKLLHRVASLETKFVNSERRRNPELDREVTRLLNRCCPHGSLQEREFGIHSLMTRLGPSLLDALYESMDTRTFAHRLVYF
jgi:bacillithiol biosynthesis cysteine-adding enzyme BshC